MCIKFLAKRQKHYYYLLAPIYLFGVTTAKIKYRIVSTQNLICLNSVSISSHTNCINNVILFTFTIINIIFKKIIKADYQ